MAMNRLLVWVMASVLLLLSGGQAHAWGDSGHRIIGRLGMESLPPQLPAFLRTPEIAEQVAEYAREPDRWRNAGKLHDSDRDAAHFVNLDDLARAESGDRIDQLPPRRVDFEAALAARHTDVIRAGYLPYAILDGYQQLAKDFAYYRVETLALERETKPSRRAWYAKDLEWRKALIVRDIGVWAHYVGDGSQPMHLSIHYNGWGNFPNPNNYTLAHVHAAFEGQFVRDQVSVARARAALRPYRPCPAPIDSCVAGYLKSTWSELTPYYEIEKRGGFRALSPEAIDFTTHRVADGAAELRDLIILAWSASTNMKAGYHGVTAMDVQHGADAWEALYGDD